MVVSSRPHASQHFHKQATVRVDILGFTETEREHYIKLTLPDQPHKVEKLTQYLHQQPSVDSICFSPFNMVILLYLYKLGIPLPKNSIELYHHFICSTINRHLSKFGKYNITDLTDLPDPYNRIIQQLSKLSLEALNNNQLVFTLEEITTACPDIAAIQGAGHAAFWPLRENDDTKFYTLYNTRVPCRPLHFPPSTKRRAESDRSELLE